MTLREWVLLLVLGFLCVGTARADIMDCVHRGKLAAGMVYAVSEGYELDKVNVTFRIRPRNPVEQAESDKYVESVRKEVAELLKGKFIPARDQDFANSIGIKVSEACAFEYGKRHGTMKETATHIDNEAPIPADEVLSIMELRSRRGADGIVRLRSGMCTKFIKREWREVACPQKTGSVPPMTEEQASNLMMQIGRDLSELAASSQGMAESNARYKECEELLTDQIFIARQLSRGKSPDALRNLARTSLEPLPQDRLEKVLKLIDEAEKAMSENGLREWFDSYWQACYDGK